MEVVAHAGYLVAHAGDLCNHEVILNQKPGESTGYPVRWKSKPGESTSKLFMPPTDSITK